MDANSGSRSVYLSFAGGTWLYTQHLSENQAELLAARDIHVPVGQRTEITLNDGTRIWLNSNTTLHIESQKEKTCAVSA